ncbi:phage tail protein I [Aeromonas salmonicida]
MATLYPVWRGSLTYHDGTLSHDGAALYRGTLQGADDPAPDAISSVSIGLSPGGIETGDMGSLALVQRAKVTGISQGVTGTCKLTSRAKPLGMAEGAIGDLTTTSTTNITTMGDLLAMGVLDMSTQISVEGVNAGAIGAPYLSTRARQSGIMAGAINEPTVKQPLAPSGITQAATGNHKTRVRQTLGGLSAGMQGDPRLKARMSPAPTAFTGAMGTPIAKYAQIIYPTAPALPAPSMPALIITLAHHGIAAPQLSEPATVASLRMQGIASSHCGIPKVHRIPLATPTTRDLLPPSVTRLEHLAAATLASNLTPEVITSTRFADTCPAPLLPWLAWARSVDWWELAESEDQQRALIRASFQLHQRKGTPWAIKEALNVLGFGDSTIIERATGRRYDGTLTYNGNETHGDPTQWAVYRVILARPVTTAQANRIKRLLAEMAPARCHLAALDYTMAPLSYNGAATYNGNYNHGAS